MDAPPMSLFLFFDDGTCCKHEMCLNWMDITYDQAQEVW